jgi:hypothetical protein
MKKEMTRTRLEEIGLDWGLYMDHYSPGDGVTRYRFFREPADYFDGNGLHTALGLAEAEAYVRGYIAGVIGERDKKGD